MSKETIAQALALSGQDAALPAGWDGEESIGLRLIRDAAALREELAHLRKAALRTELALHKANHENDRLRAALEAAERPLMLTDRGDPGGGYGVGGQDSALPAIEDGGLRRQLQNATNEEGMLYG